MENLISSKIVYSCPIFQVEEADVELKDGNTAKRWYVVKNDAVAVLCVRNDKIILLKEYRSASNTFEWRIPSGSVENGEEPVNAAIRELTEEVGLEPTNIKMLKSFKAPSAWIKQNMHCFIATEFREKKLFSGDEQEGAIQIHELSFEEVKELLDKGEIPEGTSRFLKLIL